MKDKTFALVAVILMMASALCVPIAVNRATDGAVNMGTSSNPLNSLDLDAPTAYEAYAANGPFYVKVGGSVRITSVADDLEVLSYTPGFNMNENNGIMTGTLPKAGTLEVEFADLINIQTLEIEIVAVATSSDPQVRTVTLVASPLAGGRFSNSALVVANGSSISTSGSTITIGGQTSTAYAWSGYEFAGWSVNSGTVTSDMTITANFTRTAADVKTVTFAVSNASNGQVTPSSVTVPAGTTFSASGNEITFSDQQRARAFASGFNESTGTVSVFSGWSTSAGIVNSNITITANFSTIQLGTHDSPRSSLSVSDIAKVNGLDAYVLSGSTVTVSSSGVAGDLSLYSFRATQGGTTLASTTTSNSISFTASGFQDIDVVWTFGDNVRQLTVHVATDLTLHGTSGNSTYRHVTGDNLRSPLTDGSWYTDQALTSPVSKTNLASHLYQKAGSSKYTVTFVVAQAGAGTVTPSTLEVNAGSAISIDGDAVVIGNQRATATANSPWHFRGWVGAYGTVDSDKTITVNFRNWHYVEVVPNDASMGKVNKDGGSFENRLLFSVDNGTTISVSGNNLRIGSSTISSNSTQGYELAGWNPSSGTVGDDITVTAVFRAAGTAPATTYMVSVDTEDSSKGSVRAPTGAVGFYQAPFAAGTVVAPSGTNGLTIGSSQCTAVPAEGYELDGWYIGTSKITSPMTIEQRTNITAKFVASSTSYLVTISAGAHGSVDKAAVAVAKGATYTSSGGVLTFSDGTRVTATPASGYVIDTWSPSSGTVNGATTISVRFIQNIPMVETYNVAVTAGAHGSIDKARVTVDKGTTYTASGNRLTFSDGQTVTATPDAGYRVKSWTPASGTVNAASSVQVEFELSEAPVATYWVTVDSADYSKGSIRGPNGTIVSGQYQAKFPDGARITLSGSDSIKVEGSTFTAVPADGCQFDGWYIGGTKVTSARTVAGPVTILATFSESAPAALSVVDSARNVLVGKATSIPVIWTPADAPATVTASGNGLTVTASGGNVVVTAPAAGDYSVTVSVSAPGYESATGTVSVHAVAALSFTNDPSAGCVIRGAA